MTWAVAFFDRLRRHLRMTAPALRALKLSCPGRRDIVIAAGLRIGRRTAGWTGTNSCHAIGTGCRLVVVVRGRRSGAYGAAGSQRRQTTTA